MRTAVHPPSIFVGNSPYLRGTKFVPQHDMTSFDMFFLDWSKLQRSKLRQLCSFEVFVNLRRIRGHEEHALVATCIHFKFNHVSTNRRHPPKEYYRGCTLFSVHSSADMAMHKHVMLTLFVRTIIFRIQRYANPY